MNKVKCSVEHKLAWLFDKPKLIKASPNICLIEAFYMDGSVRLVSGDVFKVVPTGNPFCPWRTSGEL